MSLQAIDSELFYDFGDIDIKKQVKDFPADNP